MSEMFIFNEIYYVLFKKICIIYITSRSYLSRASVSINFLLDGVPLFPLKIECVITKEVIVSKLVEQISIIS